MARVSNNARSITPVDSLAAEVAEYQVIKGQVDELEKRKKTLRDSLMEAVKTAGEPDDKGHLWFDLGDEINGVQHILAERRVTQSLTEERAQEILDSKGLLDRCTKTILVVDHDEVMACLYKEEISEADVDSMFTSTVTWALRLK